MADGICDVPKCNEVTYMGWRPLSEKIGRQICETHWNAYKSGRFDLYDAFGFRRTRIKSKPVNVIEHCSCGRELQPGHRLCRSCATERERERKREYYHRSKAKESAEIISLQCKQCGKKRLPGHSYCGKCAKIHRFRSRSKINRKYYNSHRA